MLGERQSDFGKCIPHEHPARDFNVCGPTLDVSGKRHSNPYRAHALLNCFILLFVLLVANAARGQTYTTNFPAAENPISENGRWVNGGTVGLDWNNVATKTGFAYGTNSGTVNFADAWALLNGGWGPDQTAQAVIAFHDPNPDCHQEFELILRGNLSAHSATGYEITVRAAPPGAPYPGNPYLIIVRWNGALGNFNYLKQLGGDAYGVKTGDVFKATIVGNVITAYINGVQKAQVTDSRYATGNPGMGFYLDNPSFCSGTSTNYGYTSYTAVSTNRAPVASNDSATTAQDTAVSIAVLANDSDPDNDSLSIASFTQPAHGSTAINAGNTVLYTPASGYSGSDSFSYTAKDPSGALSNSATVSVSITHTNRAPVANSQTITIDEDTAAAITLTGSDPDGNPLTYTVLTNPTQGTLAGLVPNLKYTPVPNYSGRDSFSFKVNDGATDSLPGIISININPVNDPPLASNGALVTAAGVPATGNLVASDVDSPTLTYSIVVAPKKGNITLAFATGIFTYTPSPKAKGTDIFTFRASDGAAYSNVARFTVTIK